jgi:hypothetical protein
MAVCSENYKEIIKSAINYRGNHSEFGHKDHNRMKVTARKFSGWHIHESSSIFCHCVS